MPRSWVVPSTSENGEVELLANPNAPCNNVAICPRVIKLLGRNVPSESLRMSVAAIYRLDGDAVGVARDVPKRPYGAHEVAPRPWFDRQLRRRPPAQHRDRADQVRDHNRRTADERSSPVLCTTRPAG